MPNPDAQAGTITRFYMTGAANLDTEITQWLTDVRPRYASARIPTTTMGNADQSSITGAKENGYELEGVWDAAVDAFFMPKVGGTASPGRYAPGGSAAGMPQHNSSMRVSSYQPPANVGGAVLWSATTDVQGAVTRGTF